MTKEKKLIISLTGAKRSGKSTAGEILSYMFPDAKVTAIASKLKQSCSNAYDLEPIFFESQDLKERNLIYPIKTDVLKLCELINSFKIDYNEYVNIDLKYLEDFATYKMQNARHIMQQVGMLIRNIYGKDIHMKHLDLSQDVTIITDVRFKNEFDWLNNRKDSIHLPLYIKNDLVENSGDTHISEKEYLTFVKDCITIDNSDLDIFKLSEKLEDVIYSRFS